MKVYHLCADIMAHEAWLDLRIAMGERPAEVLGWKSIPDAAARTAMKNKFVDMEKLHRQMREEGEL
jgi:hypothetical protein